MDTLGEFGRVMCWLQTLRSWIRWMHEKSLKDSTQRKWNWEHPLWHENTQFEEKAKKIFFGESEGSSTTSGLTFGCPWGDKWRLVNVRKLDIPSSRWTKVPFFCSRREESFSTPLKYIKVSRTTQTNLDVKQEKRIDDSWISMDLETCLILGQVSHTQFTLFEKKAPDGYMWSGWRLTKKHLTFKPDHLWPELWKSMGKNTKLKEKQKRSEEKKHLENARKFLYLGYGRLFLWIQKICSWFVVVLDLL